MVDQPSNIDKSVKRALAKPGLAIANHKEVKIQMQHVDQKDHEKAKAKAGENSKISADGKLKMRALQFKGIDERADEFIAKFRQDMKLQREQSILEFQEMLKRSA